jgi:hypothetical protein
MSSPTNAITVYGSVNANARRPGRRSLPDPCVDPPDQPDDLAPAAGGQRCSIADLHRTLQIAFGRSDSHLHRFHIHGRDYGIGKIGGIGFSTDAKRVRLADFRFRINERFRYEYDFGDAWQHEVRIEQRLPLERARL